jgi:hypothetical protein
MANTGDTLKFGFPGRSPSMHSASSSYKCKVCLTCLYEVLLHTEAEQTASYVQAAYVAATL